MNVPKVDVLDYIHFRVAAQRVFTPPKRLGFRQGSSTHQRTRAYPRLLKRIPSDTEALWQEVAPFVQPDRGVLVVDDTILGQPHTRKMALVRHHWSGKHKRVVQGINLILLLWTEGQARLPCDFRLYNRGEDGLTRNDHFRPCCKRPMRVAFSPSWSHLTVGMPVWLT